MSRETQFLTRDQIEQALKRLGEIANSPSTICGMNMVGLLEVVEAALSRDGVWLSGATQEFLRSTPNLGEVPQPSGIDERHLVVAAALLELLALRTGQQAPNWTDTIGGLREPFFLVSEAESMKNTRIMCEQESPEPLRKRKLLAPPQFLTWA